MSNQKSVPIINKYSIQYCVYACVLQKNANVFKRRGPLETQAFELSVKYVLVIQYMYNYTLYTHMYWSFSTCTIIHCIHTCIGHSVHVQLYIVYTHVLVIQYMYNYTLYTHMYWSFCMVEIIFMHENYNDYTYM